MKRLMMIIGVLVCLVAASVLSLPFILSSELVRGRILSHLNELTGSFVNFRGDPSVSLSPFLGIELADLTIRDPNSDESQAVLLRVETVKAKLDVLPAILGDIQISEYQLVRPVLSLIQRPENTSSWNFNKGALHDALEAERASIAEQNGEAEIHAKLGSFEILDGTVLYSNTSSQKEEKIAGISGAVYWVDTRSEMSIDTSAIWRNESIKADIRVANPLRIFSGGASTISAMFESAPLTFELNGQANMLSDLFVEGDIEAETPSINRLTEFLNTGIGKLPMIGAWRASGKLNATNETTLLSDATLQINEQVATGVVRIAQTETGSQKLDGTLAFDQIQLTEYLKQGENDPGEFNTAAPANLDIDLRISANSMDTGRFVLGNVAATIKSSEKGWQFDIGNAEAFGGSLVAQIASEFSGENPQLSLKFNTRSSDATELESLIGKQDWSIDGELNLKGDLRTQLNSASLADHRFNGELEASSQNGSINGINFGGVFDTIQQGKAGVISKEISGGNTDYETLDLKVYLSNSIASISQASLQIDETQVQFLGDADLSKGTLALRAQRIGSDGPIPGRIIIGGTLSDPLVTIRSIPDPAGVHPERGETEESSETKQEAG